MTTYRTVPITIGELLRLAETDQLDIQPKFQRRALWKPQGRSFLIDTIMRGIPMPKIYLRDYRDPDKGHAVLQVVDGQQRMRALRDFRRGVFGISAEHAETEGDRYFGDLSFDEQRKFIDYKVTAEVLEDASDEDVWRLFGRLNRYTVPINKQEYRQARFGGPFKVTSYELSEKHKDALKELRVVTQSAYSRMLDAELVSDIVVAIVDGISDINQLDDKYETYDVEFPKASEAKEVIGSVINTSIDQFLKTVRETKFHSKIWFYSFAVALADCLHGIPGEKGPTPLADHESVAENMRYLDDAMRQPEPPGNLIGLSNALTKATSHISARKLRHEQFVGILSGKWQAQ